MLATRNNASEGDTADPAASARFPLMVSVYIPAFLVSEIGNGIVIYSLAYLKRRQRTVVDSYILNLALADLLLTTLTLFTAIEYLKNEWNLGEAMCKIHGQMSEACYAVSVLTLLVISYNRCKAVNDPFKILNAGKALMRRIVLIWLAAFVLTSPLAYAYTVAKRNNRFHCMNTNFNVVSRQIYYLLQAVILFFVPILVLISSQRKIRRGLQQRSGILKNTFDSKNANWRKMITHERKINKFLSWIWIVFVCCFSPFVIVRAIIHLGTIRKNEILNQIWHGALLAVLFNSAINPFLYYRTTNRDNANVSRIVKLLCCIRPENMKDVTRQQQLQLNTSHHGSRCNE